MDLDSRIRGVSKFLMGNYSASRIEKETGVSRVTIAALRRKEANVLNVKVKTLKKVDDFLTKAEYRSIFKSLAMQTLVSDLIKGTGTLSPSDIIPKVELLETPYKVEYLWVDDYNLGIDMISGQLIDSRPITAKVKEEREG